MKKIMFNDQYGLTLAVLEGRKTMTRRIIPQKIMNAVDVKEFESGNMRCWLADTIDERWFDIRMAAHYKVGEVVAVAQSGKDIYRTLQQRYGETSDAALGFMEIYKGMTMWNNKMFTPADLMPHQIRITDIKVERLQDISNEDCLKEGIFIDENRKEIDNNIYAYDVHGKHTCRWWFPSAKLAFSTLIERPGIGHKGDWSKNPWVFVYSFELVNL